jgi:catechol 2,3-dioxygenase-like lactoylglutathione lyase family enzyme
MKTLSFALCLAGLVLASPIDAQGPPGRTPFKPVEGAFFALSVADIRASSQWYRDKLGLEVVLDIPPQGGTAVTVLEGGGLTVELLQHANARSLSSACPGVGDPQLVHGFVKAGFVVKDFDGVVAELRARGVDVAYGPFPASDTQKANVILRDNSGNLIQVFGR